MSVRFAVLAGFCLGIGSAALAASPDEILEHSEPRDEADPAYLGRCEGTVTVSADHHAWRYEFKSEGAWGDAFDARGVFKIWGSPEGPDGPIVSKQLEFSGPVNKVVVLEPPRTDFKYFERGRVSWCHAYRNVDTRPYSADDGSEDFKDPRYLGHCHLKSMRTGDGRWQLWVEGDPDWGNFYALLRYAVYGSKPGSDGRFGYAEYDDVAYASVFNNNNSNIRPEHSHWSSQVSDVERIDEEFCHALRPNPQLANPAKN